MTASSVHSLRSPLRLPLSPRRRAGAELHAAAARRDRNDHPRLFHQTSRDDRGIAGAGGRPRRSSAVISEHKDVLLDSPRQVDLGNPKGDVTMVEFFDYNCGYCKSAPRRHDDADEERSQSAHRAEGNAGPRARAAWKRHRSQRRWRCRTSPASAISTSTRSCSTGRGQADKARALAVAKEAGADMARLEKDMASAEVEDGAGRELQAGRSLQHPGHPILRDRQRGPGRRGRPQGIAGQDQHRPLRQGDLLIGDQPMGFNRSSIFPAKTLAGEAF